MSDKNFKTSIVRKITEIPIIGNAYAKYRILKGESYFLSDQEIAIAERNWKEKSRIVSNHLKKHQNWFKEDVAMVNKLLMYSSPSIHSRDDKERIRVELIFYRIGYGFHPEEYVCYELEDKSAEDRKQFLSARECVVAALRMNDYHEKQILKNKGLTYKQFSDYYKRDAVYIEKESDFDQYLSFIRKHPVFVKKDVYEAMGRSVELIDLDKIEVSEKELFNELIKKGPHLLEERVIQCETMGKLHSSSVNTIRSITFNTKSGIKDMYYFMKIGQGGSFVDNGGAGGILVGVDNATGKLITDGFDELNRRYECHPDTGTVFKGYQLPEWNQLKRISLELSSCLPKVKYIGWDFAHTNQGWVLIEGNSSSQMIGPQTVFKRGCKKEVYDLMADM